MIGDLPDFRLETWFSRWEFAATHTFTASDAQTMSVAELLARAGRDVFDLADIDLGYRPTYGSAELRDAVAAAQYHVVSPDDVLAVALAELWHDRGMVLLCDEVYRGIEVEPCTTLPHGADLTASAVSVNVMSKSYGFPGLRVGWVATRDRACSNASSGASTTEHLQPRPHRAPGDARPRCGRRHPRPKPCGRRHQHRTRARLLRRPARPAGVRGPDRWLRGIPPTQAPTARRSSPDGPSRRPVCSPCRPPPTPAASPKCPPTASASASAAPAFCHPRGARPAPGTAVRVIGVIGPEQLDHDVRDGRGLAAVTPRRRGTATRLEGCVLRRVAALLGWACSEVRPPRPVRVARDPLVASRRAGGRSFAACPWVRSS